MAALLAVGQEASRARRRTTAADVAQQSYLPLDADGGLRVYVCRHKSLKQKTYPERAVPVGSGVRMLPQRYGFPVTPPNFSGSFPMFFAVSVPGLPDAETGRVSL